MKEDKMIWKNSTPFRIDANFRIDWTNHIIEVEFTSIKRIFFAKLQRFICNWGKSQGLK